MRITLVVFVLLISGCVWQFSLMKDCDKSHIKEYSLQYRENCEFNRIKH